MAIPFTRTNYIKAFHSFTEYFISEANIPSVDYAPIELPEGMSRAKIEERFRIERAKILEHDLATITNFDPEPEAEVPSDEIEATLVAFRAATTKAEKKALRAKLRRLGHYLSKQVSDGSTK